MRPVASLGAVPRQTTNTGGLFCGPREQAGVPASCESMHLNKQDSTSSGTATNDGGGLNPIRVKVFIFLASGAPDPFPFVREIKERYALASILGRGSFGDVILAFDKPCVLRLLDHVLTPDDTFLVLQFCEGGPLSGVVFPRRTLNERGVKTVFYQLTLAVQYLHDIGIVHRDIKASILLDNILLFSKEPETLIKLIDFGASNCSGSLALGTPIGSSLYVAPEVLRASLVGSTYCHQADVWSAGVVLFLCLGGYQPFLDHNSILNGDFNLEPSVWDKVSPPARDLVQRMLEVDTRLRISVKHILGHKWMKDNIGLVIRAHGYRYRGSRFDSWHSVKQLSLERGQTNVVRTNEELLE
uniref:Protein kinase domain-containing protein n=1 Tax=Timema tahoe TaxID=61484 RepID=A0A7R9ILE2_9NEOP|nr:unnamed protein product [Timema tahoe]